MNQQQVVSNHKAVNSKDIVRILEKSGRSGGGLIAVLEAIQAEYGFLPEAGLRIVSQKTGRSLVDIYGVATFYKFFSLQPKGKHLVCACLGTACHVRGAPRIVAELEQQLGIQAGQTTPDREFTLETVNCLGACALGPVIVIDGHYFSKVRKSQVKQLLEQAKEGFDKLNIGKDERIFPLEASCPHCRHSLKDETFVLDGYPCLKVYAQADSLQGWLRLSCLYGSPSMASEVEIPEGIVVTFICPHCRSAIRSTSDCSECEAPMIAMPVDGGGILHICSRRGCRNHRLDLVSFVRS